MKLIYACLITLKGGVILIYNKKVTAVILAAGNSVRYGQNKNKNLEIINGKQVLFYSLTEFDKNKYIDNIIIAVKKDEIPVVESIIKKENLQKKVDIVVGGDSRKASVYNSIKSTNADIVIIHDGARAFIKQDYINKCVESMNEFKGVAIGVKSKDTIKITDENGLVINTTNRSNTWLIQTPQCFDRDTLLKMHEKYKTKDVTDDCMLLEEGDYKVKILEGDYSNIKITTYDDLNLMKELMKQN